MTFGLFQHLLIVFCYFSTQRSCISCSKWAFWWTRVFRQCFCNCSPAPFVAVKWWPAPPLRPSLVEAAAVLDRLEHHNPLRASRPVRRARKRTKRKTKMVRQSIIWIFFSLYLSENWTKYHVGTIDGKYKWTVSCNLIGFCLGWLATGDGVGSQEDQLCMALVSQLNKFADKETLIQFLRCFLLESNSSAVRWQAHCLALHIYR